MYTNVFFWVKIMQDGDSSRKKYFLWVVGFLFWGAFQFFKNYFYLNSS